MPRGYLLHDLHGELVVVRGDIGYPVNARQLMLGRGHLVVLCFSQNPKLPQLLVQLLHVGFYPGLDGAEVVVIHLLPLGGLSTEQRPAAENKVFPLFVHGLINEKVLLLRADAGTDTLDVLVAEQPQHPHGLLVQGLHGAFSYPAPRRRRSRRP